MTILATFIRTSQRHASVRHQTFTQCLKNASVSSTGAAADSLTASLKRPIILRFCSASPSADHSNDSSNQEQVIHARRLGIRDVAVIAHVDHGKTSLVDQLLHASAGTSASSSTRLLDSSDLEKERGITITSKVTRLEYEHNDTSSSATTTTIINVVDTPGHADFCGEVDRILSMVDGVLLVVDIVEGPKSQTKYVLNRALALGLKPVVVLNKCDKPEALQSLDSGETEQLLHTLFEALGATPDQLDYVTAYASARNGWVTLDPLEALELAEEGFSADSATRNSKEDNPNGMHNLLQAILEEIPEPLVVAYSDEVTPGAAVKGEAFQSDPFSLAAVTVGYDPYLGRTCTGRITSGSLSINDSVTLLKRDGNTSNGPSATASGIFVYKGISRIPLSDATAYAGDIIQITGIPDSIAVGDTLTSTNNPVSQPIQTPPLAPPTLAMDFGSNTGPLAGQEGSKIASSQIRQRLLQETDNNVTLIVKPSDVDVEKTTVFARGELQLGILIETMRREGFEMIISPPRILTRTCPDTKKTLEPYEEVTVDVDAAYASTVVSALTGDRKGILMSSEVMTDGKARLVLEVPTRGLLGFNNEIATATKGSAVVNHLFIEDREFAGSLGTALEKGKLVSNASGKATSFALDNLQQRGTLFIEPQSLVYPGMVIGENSKIGDLEVNPVKAKEVTNMRTQSKDEKSYLAPPKRLSVEELIGYMGADEMIEVTPQSVRLRKELLESGARERAARTKAKQIRAAAGK